jgi:hypothetical protein
MRKRSGIERAFGEIDAKTIRVRRTIGWLMSRSRFDLPPS